MLASNNYLLLSPLLMMTTQTVILCSAGFTLTPTEVVVSPSSGVAVFNCQHDTADLVSWRVNSTSFSHFSEHLTTRMHLLPYGAPLHQLRIPTNPEYNMTRIVCLALFIDGSPQQMTNPVYLILQDNARPLPSGFIEEPYPSNMELILAVGESAVFRCQHCSSDNIRWRLNGTLIKNGKVPDAVSISYSSQSSCGILFTLTIFDIEHYNETTIVCEANVEGSSMVATPVTLLVQGTLDPVSNLTRKFGFGASSYYTWRAPFSLDVTNADPDIIYCLHISPTSCGSQPTMLHEVTFANCNVTDTNFTIPNINELYQIEVLPRTNLDVALNGTKVEYRDRLIHFENEAVSYTISNALGDNVQIKLLLNLQRVTNEVLPSRIVMELMAVDENSPTTTCSIAISYDENSTLSTFLHLKVSNCSVLEMKRLYIGTLRVPVVGCNISNDIELSTHMIRNITVSHTTQPNEILVSGDFINTTDEVLAPGFMAIVYTESESNPDFHYGIATRLIGELHAEVNISRLLKHKYRVSVFTLQVNGLPFMKSAAIARTVTNKAATNHTETDSVFEIQNDTNIVANITSSGPNCHKLNCTFMNTSATHCTAVISEKAQTTTKYGLLKIEVYNFKRDGDTATGCLPDVNNADFNVDVFAFHDNMLSGVPIPLIIESHSPVVTTESHSPAETAKLGIIFGSVLIVIGLIVVAVVILIVLWLRHILKNSPKKKLVVTQNNVVV